MYSNFIGVVCIILYMYFLKYFWSWISYVLYFCVGLRMYCMTAYFISVDDVVAYMYFISRYDLVSCYELYVLCTLFLCLLTYMYCTMALLNVCR